MCVKIRVLILGLTFYAGAYAGLSKDSSSFFDDYFGIHALEMGDSISYHTFRTSCLSGEMPLTSDSVMIYRNVDGCCVIYHKYRFQIDMSYLNVLMQVESRLWQMGHSERTSYYMYCFRYHGFAGLLGSGGGNYWEDFIGVIIKNSTQLKPALTFMDFR